MTTIVIADDHPVVLNGIEQVLRAERDFRVVAACADGECALAAVQRHDPDVLIVDLRMPRKDGLQVLRELKDGAYRTRSILLTANLEVRDIRQSILLGASGVILKESAVHQLVSCIRSVAAGERWLDAANIRRLLVESANSGDVTAEVTSRLSEAELDAFFMAACGLGADEIARAIGATETGIRLLTERICSKLGVQSPSELSRFLAGSDAGSPVSMRDAQIYIASRDGEGAQIRRLQKQFGLTPREAAVSLLLAHGLSNKEIADRLQITINTVKTHVAAIHAKAEVSSTRKLLVVLRSA